MKVKVENNTKNRELENSQKKRKKKADSKKQNNYPIGKKNRRKARRSKKYRKLRVAIAYFIAIIIFISIGVVFSIETLFKVKNIEVIGQSVYSNEEIIEASEISEGLNMFMSNINFNDDLIESKLPYVKKATLKKKIPSTIQIAVESAVPVGAIEYGGKYLILDKDSKVLEISESPLDLPALLGIELDNFEISQTVVYKNPELLKYIEEISTAFMENGLFNITYIDFTDLMNVRVSYEGRINIKLGKPIDLKYKIDSVGRVFKEEQSMSWTTGELDASIVKENNKVYFNPVY